jgi:hypothetical protein
MVGCFRPTRRRLKTDAIKCHDRPTGALLFIAGTNGALMESPDKSTLLNIGNSTQLSVERDESRLAFDADIYNNTGNLAVRIVRNEFNLVSGEYSYQERSGDRSTITVYNKQGGEMLYVYRLPPV